MDTTEQPRFLTLREVAELLRIHPRTAYRYVEDGVIPAAKIGGQWRVSRAELERRFRAGAGSMNGEGA